VTLLDCHCHVVPDAVLTRFPDGTSPRFVTAERTVLERLLAAQESAGVTHGLLSDSFYMESAAEELPAWDPIDRARLYNDGLADLLARFPGRFFGLACLDPFAGEAAARELERAARELGFVGALVSPSDGRRFLDDPAAAPLLAAADQLGLPLFIHPSRDLPAGEQYDEFALSLIVGRPAQTALCASRLIFSGALDRHPGLRLLLAHAGGALPFLAGRLDATWSAFRRAERWVGPDLLQLPPSAYLRRFWVDANTWSTAALRLVLDLLGVDRLVFGSDQPPIWFPLEQSVAAVACLDLSGEDDAGVRWANAARLFGLEERLIAGG
jgi:aminocarboxymuconate-semialdehyde decarboxylase